MNIKYLLAGVLILFLVSGCAKEVEEAEVKEVIEEKEEVVEEVPEFVSHIVVILTEEKIMDPSDLQISKGDVIKWVNEDTNFYHNLVIYSSEIERPMPDDLIIQSGNIAPGNSWEYTFEESGDYTIRDIYSGTMSGKITAKVIADTEGKVIGTISVS